MLYLAIVRKVGMHLIDDDPENIERYKEEILKNTMNEPNAVQFIELKLSDLDELNHLYFV